MNKKIKKGFTLVEIVIAIALFSISLIILFNITKILQKQRDRAVSTYRLYHQIEEIKKLFFMDLINEQNITIDNDKKITIFKTTNSLYGFTYPYVAYILKNHILYRIESYKNIDKNLKTSTLESARILVLSKKCKDIRFFKDDLGITIFFKIDKEHIFKVFFLNN